MAWMSNHTPPFLFGMQSHTHAYFNGESSKPPKIAMNVYCRPLFNILLSEPVLRYIENGPVYNQKSYSNRFNVDKRQAGV